MATTVLTRGTTLSNSATKTEFHNLVDTATGVTTGIVNADIDAAAAIANSKLNLAAVAQNVAFSGTVGLNGVVTIGSKILKLAKGADVASAAGAITLGEDGNYFDITGTAAITSITAKAAGTNVVLQFDSTASLVDGGNLKLNGNFQGAAESTIQLVSDGINWFEVSRSLIFASAAEVTTGTEAAKPIAPSTVIAHHGVIKGWINMNGTGTVAINDSYNVSGIVDNGTGDYTITWETDFGSTSYAISGSAIDTSGGARIVMINSTDSLAAGAARILVRAQDNSAADASVITVLAIGDR